MNIGIIGTGNMGNILIDACIEARAVKPSCLTIINRTFAKAYHIKEKYPSIHIAKTIQEVIERSELIFICVKPLDIHTILTKHASILTNDKCLISITSPISTGQLETIVSCHVARIIPSITNRALAGGSLCTFGKNCSQEWQRCILNLFQKISKPIIIEENITRVASDIASCGPAFFSYLLQRFIDASVEETNITREEATILTSEMIIGMGKLLEKQIFTLPTLQEKVCVKGGITGEGIRVLDEHIGDLFNKVLKRTHEKYEEDVEHIEQQFNKH
ncbi:late competence protein ComER [Bacillus sp. S10(2024)]|uniref:late competence protein ComER n=1 Tax=Bacillus sp. S10(2024) TaxID=3162886 RepID=UPI003D2425AF